MTQAFSSYSGEDYNGERTEVRLGQPLVVFVENCCDPALPVFITQALDVSANGLQLSMDCELALGAVLSLGIEQTTPAGRAVFNLIGEVRWCEPQEAGGFAVGFQLLEAQDTDLARWKLAVVDMLGDESIALK